MSCILESNRIKMITTPNGNYTCIFDLETEVCKIYYNKNKDLIFLKSLLGQGVFLNDNILLMFYNNSGYGYGEGDSYLFYIDSGKILPFYYESFDELSESNKWSGGYFISFSSNILVTNTYLIMKDEFGGVYFYYKDEILKKRKLDFFYCLPSLEDNKIDTLFNFDDSTHVLRYSYHGEGFICEQYIDFSRSSLKAKSGISLQLKDEFYSGFSLDYHTISSRLTSDGRFETVRTKIGEALYKLKYRRNKTVIKEISETASSFIKSEFHNVDVIIPVPPSDVKRQFQPVITISNAISELTQIPTDSGYLIKTAQTFQIKGIDDNEKRKKLLHNAFSVIDKRYQAKTILLFDDLYRSGETLNAAAKVLKEQGEVGEIYVLTITKTRTKR